MTAADQILNALEGARIQALKQRELTEMEIINPSDDCLRAIEAAGGEVVSTRYEQWCNSDTCAHNSHDGGARYAVVGIKETWKPSKDHPTGKLFEDVEDEKILLVVENEGEIVGIFERDHGRHFAETTVSRKAKMSAD